MFDLLYANVIIFPTIVYLNPKFTEMTTLIKFFKLVILLCITKPI